MTGKTRRHVLTTAGTLSALTLAGCVSGRVDEDLPFLGGDDAPSEVPTENGDDQPPDTNGADDNDPTDHDEEELDLPGEAIDDFSDLDQWFPMVGQGNIEAATDEVYHGKQSARIRAEEGVDYAGVYREFHDPLDLTEQNLSLALQYVDQEMLDVTVQVRAPNSRNYLNHRRVLTGPSGHWMRIDLGANYEETQPLLDEVREIRIVGRRRGTESGPIEFVIDDLRAAPRPDSGAVVLLFDATLESHYTIGLEILEEYGFAGVESVTPETVGRSGRLTTDQLREMSEAEWDMIARPRVGGQDFTEYSVDRQEEMIRGTQTYLLNRGFEDGADHFFTPRNMIGPEGMELVREYHETGFRYGGAPNAMPVTDPHNLGHFTARDVDTTESFIDLAEQYHHVAIPRFEYLGDEGIDEATFRRILDHIDQADVDVITATELLTDEKWA